MQIWNPSISRRPAGIWHRPSKLRSHSCLSRVLRHLKSTQVISEQGPCAGGVLHGSRVLGCGPDRHEGTEPARCLVHRICGKSTGRRGHHCVDATDAVETRRPLRRTRGQYHGTRRCRATLRGKRTDARSRHSILSRSLHYDLRTL